MGNELSHVGDHIGNTVGSILSLHQNYDHRWSGGLRAVLLGCSDHGSPLSAFKLHWRARKWILQPIIVEAYSVDLALAVRNNDLASISLVCCFAPDGVQALQVSISVETPVCRVDCWSE